MQKQKLIQLLSLICGQFYNITIYFKVGNKQVIKAVIYDSLKIIPFSVEMIAKTFGLPISKLELDYNRPRSRNHVMTTKEREYIKNDVLIMAKALKILFDVKLDKMTQGANALADYKRIITDRKFNHYFPKLKPEVDEKIRESYKRRFHISFR